MSLLPIPSPFTWQQAKAAGVARHTLEAWLRDRIVRRVLHGVYAEITLADDVGLRVDSLRLVLTPLSVVTDRTAAWLHGVDTFAYRELEILPPVETCVLPDANRVRRQGVKGRIRDLAADDLMDLRGLPVTTPLRTALDLGAFLGRRDALAALDGFRRLHHIATTDLDREVLRFCGRRGVIQLRSLIPLASPLAESPGESWTRITMIDDGLPVPELQWWVTVEGIPTYRLDLAYPAHRIAVEYDGRAFHDSPEQRARDEARRRWLRDHGWIVIVVTRDDFSSGDHHRWLNEIRRGLRLS